MQQQPTFIPVIDLPHQEHILVAPSPDKLNEAVSIPVDEFAKQEGFEWTDSILADPNKKRAFDEHRKTRTFQDQELMTFMLSFYNEHKIPIKKNITPEELINDFKIRFRSDPKRCLTSLKTTNEATIVKLKEFLAHPKKRSLCKINEQVGYGVFLPDMENPIATDDVVFFYAGKYRIEDKPTNYLSLIPFHTFFSDTGTGNPCQGVIDAA